MDLPALAAAREEARRFTSGLRTHQRLRDMELSDWRLTIVDEQGRELDTMPLVPAQDP